MVCMAWYSIVSYRIYAHYRRLFVSRPSLPALPAQMSIGGIKRARWALKSLGRFFIRNTKRTSLEAICEFFNCVAGLGIRILADSIDEAICPSTKSAIIKSSWILKCRNLHILRDNYEKMQRIWDQKKKKSEMDGKCMPSSINYVWIKFKFMLHFKRFYQRRLDQGWSFLFHFTHLSMKSFKE